MESVGNDKYNPLGGALLTRYLQSQTLWDFIHVMLLITGLGCHVVVNSLEYLEV